MKKRLQDISFRASRYFRPLEAWHCGGLVDGKECLLGPDKKGVCQAMADCAPDKVDNTWICTRSALLGGQCPSGPGVRGSCGQQHPPCKPVRNLGFRKRRLAWLAFAIVVSLVSLGMVSEIWRTMIDAGPLSKHHASFGTDNCEQCHSAVQAPPSRWLAAVFDTAAREEIKIEDSRRCLACHSLGDGSNSPHSLASHTLEGLSQRSQAEPENSARPSLSTRIAQQLKKSSPATPACSVCHQEHLGSNGQITRVSDRQCAICHSNAFSEFVHHPEFTNYPSESRTPIIFSHNTHINKHFAGEQHQPLAPTACVDCHSSDAIGRKMELKGFVSACSNCHLDQITGRGRVEAKGFPMLSIPVVDLDTLTARGVDIGEWPQSSDAEITPLDLLLVAASEPSLVSELDRLSALDIYDLRGASEADLYLVYRVLWALKSVFFEIQRGGPQVIVEHLKSLSTPITNQPQEIIGLLSPDLVDKLMQTAFPNLEAEMTEWIERGNPPFSSKPVDIPATDNVPLTDLDSASLINVQANGNLLDEVDNQGLILDEDDWLAEAAETAADKAIIGSNDDIYGDEDNWLEEAVDGEIATPLIEDIPDQPGVDKPNPKSFPARLSLEDRAASGGWYFEEFILRYRPSGHADRLIVAWLELLLSGTSVRPAVADAMRRSLMGKNTPGTCIKCHSIDAVDRIGSSFVKVNWLGQKTIPSEHGFDSFTHSSHSGLVLLVLENDQLISNSGCGECHKLDPGADSSMAYEDHSTSYQSDFMSLNKSQCVSCHRPESGLANCRQCHNYHIGDRSLVAKLDGGNKSADNDEVIPADENAPIAE